MAKKKKSKSSSKSESTEYTRSQEPTLEELYSTDSSSSSGSDTVSLDIEIHYKGVVYEPGVEHKVDKKTATRLKQINKSLRREFR